MTNLLVALKNIVTNPVTDVIAKSKSSNRINAKGEALEFYIKDLFCNSLNIKKGIKKNKIYEKNFSFSGQHNHPPDLILKNSDAIEVKKIESFTGGLALNSSYPKNKLHSDDSRITTECRNCEKNSWKEKDIIYAIGTIPKGTSKLKLLWFVYGDCYAANKESYERIFNSISQSILQTPNIIFSDTNELAKVKKIDPLGITDLRVRGMWHIGNPIKIFDDFISINKNKNFVVNTILLKEKYDSFPDKDRKKLETLQNKNFKIQDIKIKSPNNPVKLLKAKLISYEQ